MGVSTHYHAVPQEHESACRDTLESMRMAYIGMGGNLASWAGTAEATLASAALRLERLGRVVRRSRLYSTEPVGFAEQPRFVNAVVALQTELEARELLQGLLAIELEFGRDRSAGFQNGPRTLDLDILLFGEERIDAPGLQIPHPRLAERRFVLIPLGEIAPAHLDAGGGKSVGELLHTLQGKTESGSDAVVAMESDGWRTGSDAAGDGGAAGADRGPGDRDGGR